MWKIMTRVKNSLNNYTAIADCNNRKDAEKIKNKNPDSIIMIAPSDKNIELLKEIFNNYELILLFANKENVEYYDMANIDDRHRYEAFYEDTTYLLIKYFKTKSNIDQKDIITVDNQEMQLYNEQPIIEKIFDMQTLTMQILEAVNTLRYEIVKRNNQYDKTALTATSEDRELARRADYEIDIRNALYDTRTLRKNIANNDYINAHSCENDAITNQFLANQKLMLRYLYIKQPDNSKLHTELYKMIYDTPVCKNTNDTLTLLLNQQKKLLNDLF